MNLQQIKKITAAAMLCAVVLAGCEMATRDNPYDQKASNFGLVVYVSAANGDDLFPGSKEQPKKTIQAGISRASELFPDTTSVVRVAEGTYIENSITMINRITVLGGYSESWTRNPEVNVTIVTDNRTTGGSTNSPNRVFYVPNTVTDIEETVLDGFTIQLGAGVCNAGIFCQGNATISNSTISGRTSTTASVTEAYGISLIATSSLIITAVISHNTIDPGHAKGSSDITCGIYTKGYNSTYQCNPQINNNTTIKAGAGYNSYGISIENYSNPSILNNTQIDCGSGGAAYCIRIYTDCHPVVEYNTLTNSIGLNTMYGIIELDVASDPARVRNNHFDYLTNSSQVYYYDDDSSTSVKNLTTDFNTLEDSGNPHTLEYWGNS